MNFKISLNEAQNLLNYLVEKPYKEVYKLINILQNLEEIKEEKSKDISKEE